MIKQPRPVLVRDLLGEELAHLGLRLVCGEGGLASEVSNPRVQKPGLAFAGYYEYIKPGRVQIVGQSEIAYLATLEPEVRTTRLTEIAALDVPVFVVTKGLSAPPELEEHCRLRARPLLSSSALSSKVIKSIGNFLEERLVPSTRLHGVMLDVFGLGVLLIGKSGVGKSECALDLITRGHRLVADDRVTVKRFPHGDLVTFSEVPLKHHMELRGLGIVDIKDLFGLAAVRDRCTLDLVVELEHWDESVHYDRLGLDETVYTILETPVPFVKMPVAIGRNLSILVEIAVRNHALRLQGHNSAHELARKLEAMMKGTGETTS